MHPSNFNEEAPPPANLMALCAQLHRLLCESAGGLVERYGKLMAGPKSGLYVSGLTDEEQLDIAEHLAEARRELHLM